jgi:hypothetical protein
MARTWEQEHLETTLCRFPKYRDADKSWWDVCQEDAAYVRWLLENNDSLDDELRDALEWGVRHAPERF